MTAANPDSMFRALHRALLWICREFGIDLSDEPTVPTERRAEGLHLFHNVPGRLVRPSEDRVNQ